MLDARVKLPRGRSAPIGLCVLILALLSLGVLVGSAAAQESVSNAQELQNMDLNEDYVLTDDIDASGISNFDPVGDFNNPYTGTFDGNGYNITGLTIDRPNELDIGLFGSVGPAGTVRDVGIVDANIDGEQWTGALVGVNRGEVKNSYATGEAVADLRVGLLVGSNEGTIRGSYSEGKVTSIDIFGGLVGLNDEGTISNSYADVDVAGFESVNATNLGGLVGSNAGGDITDAYARGDVLGDDFVGGLVGYNFGEVTRSYATGTVTGDASAGVVGQNGQDASQAFDGNDGVLRDSYWNTETTAQQEPVGKEGGDDNASAGTVGGDSVTEGEVTGLTTPEMLGDAAQGNMSAFDFANTWSTTEDYPVLNDNAIPAASFTYSPLSPDVSETVTFDASDSEDPDGSVTTYEWDFDGDGTTDAQTQDDTVNHAYSGSGSYSVILSVTDDEGATDTATRTVTVSQETQSGNNPFFSGGGPLSKPDAADVLFEWNTNNGVVNGRNIPKSDMADFLFDWNLAQ